MDDKETPKSAAYLSCRFTVSSSEINPYVSFKGSTGKYWIIPCLAIAAILFPGLIPAFFSSPKFGR
jgi:hypothetical protein